MILDPTMTYYDFRKNQWKDLEKSSKMLTLELKMPYLPHTGTIRFFFGSITFMFYALT